MRGKDCNSILIHHPADEYLLHRPHPGCEISDREVEMKMNHIAYPLKDRWSCVWLLVATVLSIFSTSSGKWLIPVAAWLNIIFYLRFFRTQRRGWLAYLLTAISIAISTAVSMPAASLGVIAIPVVIGAALLGPLPLLVDRWLAPRLPGFASTLVIPLALVAFEYINTATNPMGSYGMTAAYTQYQNIGLLQLVSLTGMWGLTFLICWLGSIVNWAWENEFDWVKIKRGVLLYTGLILLVVVYGEARLWFAPTPAQTVRVAGINMVDWRANQSVMNEAFETDIESFRQMMEERYQLYFDATIREARAGAKMIAWAENAMTVIPEDEPALVTRLQALAKQEGIYLAAPIVEMTMDAPYANKLLIINPQGQVVLEHYKYGGASLEPGRITGDGILHTTQTPFGVISGIICYDTQFQQVVLQSGQNGTDILFTPSMTFRESDPMFAHLNVMRAIENGVSNVHVADGGLSVITDPYGRILAAVDHYAGGERVLVAQVPTKGAWTLYPLIGDLFAWLSMVGLAGIAIWAMMRGRRTAVRLVLHPA
jgi:apolipoprotein N-acyltransferase